MKGKITLIIAAAGSGRRMKLEKNKILLDLGGKLILERTIDKFSELEKINQLIIVAKKDEIDEISKIVSVYNFSDIRVISGGSTRQESILCGLNEVLDESNYVIVHDAARPFIKKEHILQSIKMAKIHGACGVGVRVKDTLKRVDNHNMIIDTLDRSIVWQIQTPQVFETKLIKDAYKNAICTEFVGTDDCSLVEHLGKKIAMVEGDYENIKITTKEDLDYASFMVIKKELNYE